MKDIALPEALAGAHARLEHALHEAGRPLDAAALLAVSKTQPAARLRQAYQAGQRAFGENYLQEALDKQVALADLTTSSGILSARWSRTRPAPWPNTSIGSTAWTA